MVRNTQDRVGQMTSSLGADRADAGIRDQSPTLGRLRPYNLVAGCAHLGQAVAIVVLANNFALPVRATYMTGPPGPTVGNQQVTLFDLRFAWAIAAFFALSAIAHF